MSPTHKRLLIIFSVLLGCVAALFLILSGGPSHQKGALHQLTPPAHSTASNQTQRPFVGITEENANILGSPGSTSLTTPFAAANQYLNALRPSYIRLLVDWEQLQLHEGQAPSLGGTVNGCSRNKAPCRSYAWLEAELKAVKTRQAAGDYVRPVLDIYGTPSWAAAPQTGCLPVGVTTFSAPLSAKGLRAYQQFIKDILALGKRLGVELPYWAPWNEPNSTNFIAPQRAACQTSSPPLAPQHAYAQLVEAMQSVFNTPGTPGNHQILLGELVGITSSSPHQTSIEEFVGNLPEKVICASTIWAVHDYASWDGLKRKSAVGALETALAQHSCAKHDTIWVDETGAGSARPGGPLTAGATGEKAACRAMAGKLKDYLLDPRVTAVFQYTFREDEDYPVGLMNSQMTRIYPAYYLWLAWSQRTTPEAPSLPEACG